MPPVSGNWLSNLGFSFPEDAFSNEGGNINSQQDWMQDIFNNPDELYSLFTNPESANTGSIPDTPYSGLGLISNAYAQNQWNINNPGQENDFPFDTGGDYMSATDLSEYYDDLGLSSGYGDMEFEEEAQYDLWASINEQLKLFTPKNFSQTLSGSYDKYREFTRGKMMPSILRQLKHGINLGGGGRQSNLKTGREGVFQQRLRDKYSDFMGKAENDIGRQTTQWRDMLGNAWNTMMSQGQFLQDTYNPDEED